MPKFLIALLVWYGIYSFSTSWATSATQTETTSQIPANFHFESIATLDKLLPLTEKYSYKLDETVMVFDFDETIAQRILTDQKNKYEYIGSPDLFRAYANVAVKTLWAGLTIQEQGDFLNKWLTLSSTLNLHYQLLDANLPTLIQSLKKAESHMIVCSSLPYEPPKLSVLQQIGLASKEEQQALKDIEKIYLYARGNKAQTIISYVQELKNPKIKNIVLIDNSKDHSLSPFLSQSKSIFEDVQSSPYQILGVELTFFGDLLTKNVAQLKKEADSLIPIKQSNSTAQPLQNPPTSQNQDTQKQSK